MCWKMRGTLDFKATNGWDLPLWKLFTGFTAPQLVPSALLSEGSGFDSQSDEMRLRVTSVCV